MTDTVATAAAVSVAAEVAAEVAMAATVAMVATVVTEAEAMVAVEVPVDTVAVVAVAAVVAMAAAAEATELKAPMVVLETSAADMVPVTKAFSLPPATASGEWITKSKMTRKDVN